MVKISIVALLGISLVSMLLVQTSISCDPSSAEMAVRMRMQQMLNMFPNIYEDIRQGRLTPNRYNQNGYNQGGYVQPGQQGTYIQPGQQGTYIPAGQQGTYIPAGQQGTYIPAGQTVVPSGQVVVPTNG